ncbi:MAG: Maf family nucleotide pyrophosphatase [Burkholderiales bacterium]|nr:Maf family nucleotide pyrophosphatase [Burkholderiales bacterium]
MPRPTLVLASTSPYRRELLARLRVPFEVAAPGIDETPRPGESPHALVERLSREKALAVAPRFADALVIGSDQVAVLDGVPLSKPGTHERAVAQLAAMRGRTIEFLTGVAVHATATGATHARVVPYFVEFRDYADAEAEAYLDAERPYDCAGAAKAEGLGIALIRRMAGDDPTALVGLPLIALVDLLAMHGFRPLP